MDHEAPAAKTPGLLLALTLLFVGAFLRCPPILLHGRVWAEESNIFLVGAWSRPFFTELVAPEFGYYSLWDNFFAAVAAHPAILPWVGLLFPWSALVLLLVTGWFVYQAEFLTTRLAKTCAVLSLIFVSPSAETWLNLINSEFYFGILSAVILFSNAARLRLPRALMLALAVVSGPVTTLIAPFFFLRAVLARRRGEILQAAIVCGGALLQVAVSLTTRTANRKVHLAPFNLGPVLFNKQVVLLFLNRATAKATFLFLKDDLHFTTATLAATWLIVIAGFAGLAWLLRRHRTALLLVGLAAWFALLEDSLALDGGLKHVGPGAGERYAYTPNFLLELALVVAVFTAAPLAARLWQRNTLRVLLGLALFSGVVDYFYLPLELKGVYQGEPWHQQALRWQRDPTQPLRALPDNWMQIHLPPAPQTK